MSRDEFIKRVTAYLEVQAVTPDSKVGELMAEIEEFAPHSYLSDIIYYGERHRTPEEIVDEALLREQLWERGGTIAVREHIKSRMRQALSDPDLPTSFRYSAEAILEDIDMEENAEQSSSG